MQSRFNRLFDAFSEPFDLLDDDAQREHLSRLLGISRPGLERALADLVADVVAEVNAGLDEARVDVVFRGAEGGFAIEVKPHQDTSTQSDVEEDAQSDTAPSMADAEKLTLRLPQELKERAAVAAAAAGLSLNSWIVRAVARSLDGREARRFVREVRVEQQGSSRGGSKLKGWVGG